MSRPALIRIHINQHILRYNTQNGTDHPVITVKQGGTNRYARRVDIEGPSSIVVAGGDIPPLSCSARCWVETHSPVTLTGETTYEGLCALLGTEVLSKPPKPS